MKRTTVYLPDDLKAALERVAAEQQRSEAELIRDAIRAAVADRVIPTPRVPLGGYTLGDPAMAEHADEHLAGFGES